MDIYFKLLIPIDELLISPQKNK